jgi:vitamin B12 transporter
VTPQWTLAARLNNLADKRYELVQGYNTPGSNLFVSLSYSAL